VYVLTPVSLKDSNFVPSGFSFSNDFSEFEANVTFPEVEFMVTFNLSDFKTMLFLSALTLKAVFDGFKILTNVFLLSGKSLIFDH
jgi:hypothetical protein